MFDEGDSFDSDDNDADPVIEHVANDIVFSENPPADRRWARNIFTKVPRNIAHAQSELETFMFYLPEDIIWLVLCHTNRKVRDMLAKLPCQCKGFEKQFSYDEFLACLGILIRSGSDRDNFNSLNDIWSAVDGKPFYRAVISRNRFKFFLKSVRLDNYRTRPNRIDNDKLAAVSGVWTLFVENLRRVYVPNDTLTVDEQLLGYRGSIPGRTYMPAKPRKYGLKIFWLCEAGTGFALNAQIYTGRVANEPVHRNLAQDVVMELVRPYFGTNRDIATDDFFTSHALAVNLLANGLTLLGTMRKQRREVPPVLRENRPMHSSKFLYDHASKITLVSYAPKRNRLVVLLSSSHGRGVISADDDANRPQMILDYNKGKGGVDQLNENLVEFSCVRKTVRWPLLVFFNMIDVSCNNAFIHLKRDGCTMRKKEFMRAISLQLASAFAKSRHAANRHFSRFIINAAEIFDFLPAPNDDHVQQHIGRCKVCSKVSRARCDRCQRFVCNRHKILTKTCLCGDC